MTTSYFDYSVNEGLKICAKALDKIIASDPFIDTSFDLESALPAKEFYEKFKNDLKFLSCIYDEKNSINFNNLALFVAINFGCGFYDDDEMISNIKIAKIALPKFEALIKENLANLDNKTEIYEIFKIHFADVVPPIKPNHRKCDDYNIITYKELKPFLADPNDINDVFRAYNHWINKCNFDDDSKFDNRLFDFANEFYDEFANDLKFLKFIYDEEKIVNFKNLVLFIGENFEMDFEVKIKYAPKIAKIVFAKFKERIKRCTKADFDKEKSRTIMEIFDLYFDLERIRDKFLGKC